jgi:hypothetical protein
MDTFQPTKVCVRCKIERPLAQFVRGKARRDGHTNRCLECERARKRANPGHHPVRDRSAYAQVYYRANREKYAARSLAWAQAHPEKRRDYSRSWSQPNPERAAAIQRDYRERHPEKVREKQRNYRVNNREKVSAKARVVDRWRKLKDKYGIQRHEWELLFSKQGNACAICDAKEPGVGWWCTDHCHGTGTIRGIRCHKCNLGIGHLNDDPKIIRRALTYLEAGIK